MTQLTPPPGFTLLTAATLPEEPEAEEPTTSPPPAGFVQVGHRLRVDISSSNYPRWDANPNTGRNTATETAPVTATQRIFWGGTTASHITLPVVRR